MLIDAIKEGLGENAIFISKLKSEYARSDFVFIGEMVIDIIDLFLREQATTDAENELT